MSRPKVTSITKKVLNMLFAASNDTHPREFACVLRAVDDTITEVILVPGTIGSTRSAIFRLHNLPIDFSVVGSAHSHPTPNSTPSDADLHLFAQYPVNIIVGYPYNMDSWTAYSHSGEKLYMRVI